MLSPPFLPELVSGRGTADAKRRWWRGSGLEEVREGGAATLPLHHPLRGWSPSPSELGEEYQEASIE